MRRVARLIQSCDVGSLPYTGNQNRLAEGANHFASNLNTDAANHFEQTIVNAFIDKMKTGISIPTFPQFRDMNDMFLATFDGLEKIKGGYVETGHLALKSDQGKIPEVTAIERNAQKIHAQANGSFQLRICITGPYTLASFFPHRNSQTYQCLAFVLSKIAEKNIFITKQGKVALVTIDEPLFGLVDDPLIDRGAQGRESLLSAWESIASKARCNNVETCIHLHNTSDDLFWSIKSLRIIESHVGDPLYEMRATKETLEREDKRLKASITISDFDHLIKTRLGSAASNDDLANVWKNIRKGTVKPEAFLEDADVMKKRLTKIVERFGIEKVALAGPECGLRGFPTYAAALECLIRVSETVKSVAK